MISIALDLKIDIKSLNLVRIRIPIDRKSFEPIAPDQCQIFKYSDDYFVNECLDRLKATLCCPDHPFVAWALTLNVIQVVCSKVDASLFDIHLPSSTAVVTKLFKALWAQQRALGIHLTDLKSHVLLTPMNALELHKAVSLDVLSLFRSPDAGWFPLHHAAFSSSVQNGVAMESQHSEDHRNTIYMLGSNPMKSCGGATSASKTCPMIEFEIQLGRTNSNTDGGVDRTTAAGTTTPTTTTQLYLNIIYLSIVRFRHIRSVDSLCRVLPTCTPGIVDGVRNVGREEMDRIAKEWHRAGWPLPTPSKFQEQEEEEDKEEYEEGEKEDAATTVVDVRFDEDPDAPTTPFPASTVLSFSGFDPIETNRLSSPGIMQTLCSIRSLISNTGNSQPAYSWKILPKSTEIAEIRHWNPPSTRDGLGRVNNKNEENGERREKEKEFGAVVNLDALLLANGDDHNDNLNAQVRHGVSGSPIKRSKMRKRRHQAKPGPTLLAFLAKIEAQEEEERRHHVAENKARQILNLPSSLHADSLHNTSSMPTNAVKRKAQPLFGNKNKNSNNNNKDPTCLHPGNKVQQAPPKGNKRKQDKAPSADIDVAALNVPFHAQKGTLGKLTIPQLKAFCKSVKQPVGGKKTDLECRIAAYFGIQKQ